MNKVKAAIIRTLIYSDLFSFPLKKNELWVYLKSSVRISKQEFNACLQKGFKELGRRGEIYFLEGRSDLILLRQQREEYSKSKMLIAENAVFWLAFIPTIQFIGISGSLAFRNAAEIDDIDLFIIVRKNTIWLTRLCLLLILQLIGVRRRRDTPHQSNKICVNMIISADNLRLPDLRHDTYTAQEIVQLFPLLNKNNCYKLFLEDNSWVKSFMLNAVPDVLLQRFSVALLFSKSVHRFQQLVTPVTGFLFISPLEKLARIVQLHLISRHRTTETVSDSLLAFHPYDYRTRTMGLYRKRLSAAGIKD